MTTPLDHYNTNEGIFAFRSNEVDQIISNFIEDLELDRACGLHPKNLLEMILYQN